MVTMDHADQIGCSTIEIGGKIVGGIRKDDIEKPFPTFCRYAEVSIDLSKRETLVAIVLSLF